MRYRKRTLLSSSRLISTSGVKVSEYKEDRTSYIKEGRRTIFSENSDTGLSKGMDEDLAGL